ncbi:ABC transporter permease [Protaetiibacter mangrovi]|uniref:ABC transporter permease n=1 Tax=Protaetiibacter mangrovi TaxID=2970926 RepID=A0ABT1ZDX2_9MICO|nr:ABC transporter permease [Protaetiibacter mangrovi]MCS0498890.1 ABC transporter permease [Protaetiibacter mangrovi]
MTLTESPQASPELPTRSLAARIGRRTAAILGRYGALIALGVLLVIFSFASPYFLTIPNLLQVLNQSALGAIVAGGLTLVLASGQFDLSIGYMASLAGIIVTILMLQGVPIPVAIVIALLAGVIVGVVNGFLVTVLQVNALVATLGTGSALIGVNYFISGGTPQPVSTQFPEFLQIAIGSWLGIPKPVFYMAGALLILWIVLNKTDFGRNLRATGGNVEAAKLAGVRTGGVTTAAFVIAALFASITGVLLASSIGSGQPTGGDNYTLSSFAAAFLGSTVLREGQFHIVGTLVGVVTVAVGFNGLALVGVPSFVQFLFQGILLIAAVAFSSIGRRLSRE